MLVCQILLFFCFRLKPYANGCNKVLGKYIIVQQRLEKLYFITLNYISKYTLYPEHFECMICTLKSLTMIIVTLCTPTSSLLLTWIEKYGTTWKRPNCLSFQSYVLKVSFFVNHLIDTIYVRHTYDNLHSYINLEMVCQQTQHSSYACLPNLTFIMLSSQTICKWV